MPIITKMQERNKSELISGMCLLAALFFMLFIYAPLELYFYNQREFWFDVYDLLPLLLVMFVVGFAASVAVFGVIWLCCPGLYRIVLAGSSIGFLCTYIQGNFLVGNLPAMDGSEYDWEANSFGRIQSLILWVVVFLVVVLLYKFLKKDMFVQGVKLVSLCMILMLTVTLGSILLTTKGYERKLDACATVKNEYEFSTDTNFVILLLDAVDSGDLYDLLEGQPEYKAIFEDFTYYPNTLGVYPCTMCAIPHILSGERFANETTFEEYNVNVYKNAEFFADLEEQGYRLGMYEDEIPYLDESIFRFENVLERKSEINSYIEFAKMELKLVGLRYAPYDLKKACVFRTNPFRDLIKTNEEYNIFNLSNEYFFRRLNSTDVTYTQDKCFKFIHVAGAHEPFIYDEDMNEIENGTYKQMLQANMTMTTAYLEKLKAAGVYDNSVIIVMADHGLDGENSAEYTGRQNPILFVKGVDEKHELQVSQAPISYDDLQGAFARLLEGKNSTEIFDYEEGDYRERSFLYYVYEQDEHMYEYVTSGHASEDAGMQATGREFILEE